MKAPASETLPTARIWAEILAVVLLTIAGLLLGPATPWLLLGPILGVGLPLLAATGFLHRQGLSWRDLGFPRRMPLGRFLFLTSFALAGVLVVTSLVAAPLMRWLGTSPPDMGLLVDLIEGDRVNYLLFLLPIGWGTAAFGEELLMRGFLLNRFAALFGTVWGLVLQAVLFTLGHAYQGIAGMANVFVIGLVLGIVSVRAGGNLWPAIAAHGLIDTLGLTLIYLGYAQSSVAS